MVKAKILSTVIALYLLMGLSRLLRFFPLDPVGLSISSLYLLCILIGLVGTWALFRKRLRLYRALSLFAIGIPSLIYSTNSIPLLFPTYLHIPLTVGGAYRNGKYSYCGVDLVPGVLFCALWIISQRIVGDRQQESPAPSNEAEGTHA